jgi:antitoxin ParD1/3/4
MANSEKISITLTPELAALIHEAVASGDYASPSEVIRDALRDWRGKRLKQRQQLQGLREEQLEDLRQPWEESLQYHPGGFQRVEDLIQEAEQILRNFPQE